MFKIIIISGRITGLVEGMTVQKGEAWDDTFADDIIDHLFDMNGNNFFTDDPVDFEMNKNLDDLFAVRSFK